MNGQQSLNNFYQSVKFHNPSLVYLISDDITTVSLYALSFDKTPGQEAANRLREKTRNLPVVHQRVLESALAELGYS